jgi:hypothetical protein
VWISCTHMIHKYIATLMVYFNRRNSRPVSLCLRTMPWRHIHTGIVEVKLHTFLTSAHDVDEWLALWSGRFIFGPSQRVWTCWGREESRKLNPGHRVANQVVYCTDCELSRLKLLL